VTRTFGSILSHLALILFDTDGKVDSPREAISALFFHTIEHDSLGIRLIRLLYRCMVITRICAADAAWVAGKLVGQISRATAQLVRAERDYLFPISSFLNGKILRRTIRDTGLCDHHPAPLEQAMPPCNLASCYAALEIEAAMLPCCHVANWHSGPEGQGHG
jgi:hypothetical protein